MRSLAIFVILTLMATSSIVGQRISIGGEFGVISSINNDYIVTDFENRRNTYQIGLNFNFKSNDILSFSTGIHYYKLGYRHSTCYLFEDGVKNQLVGKVDYLTIPVSANIHLLNSRKLITTFGFLGGYNIQAIQDYPEPIGGCEIYYIPNLKSNSQEFSLTGIVGIGYKIFETDKIELIPMFQYHQGLTNTYKNPIHNLNIDKKYSAALLTVKLNYKL